ncbi:MAG: hypothetical protein ACJAUL_003802 [Paraglaciecola sp.]|jgi:hypothetical protein
MFQHFVITRFNLRKKDWQTSKNKTPVLTDAWMEGRLELFEHYCFNSLKAQTKQNFLWLVFFDTSTADKFRLVIDRLAQEFSAFTPIYIDGMDQFLPSAQAQLQARLTQPYIITSRLDNDDSLHQDYIKEVQSHFSSQDFMAVDFVDGYTLQVESPVRLAKRSHVHNPFLSLIECGPNPKSVWHIERHGQWSKVEKLIPVRNKLMWMSVIHSENKVNEFLGYDKVQWETIKGFNLNGTVLAILARTVMPFNSWKQESLKNKIKTMWKVNFKLLKRTLIR